MGMCGGIHSYFLLNANLSGACGPRRRGYEPQPSFEEQTRTQQMVGRKRGSSLIRSILTHGPFRRLSHSEDRDSNADVELVNLGQSATERISGHAPQAEEGKDRLPAQAEEGG